MLLHPHPLGFCSARRRRLVSLILLTLACGRVELGSRLSSNEPRGDADAGRPPGSDAGGAGGASGEPPLGAGDAGGAPPAPSPPPPPSSCAGSVEACGQQGGSCCEVLEVLAGTVSLPLEDGRQARLSVNVSSFWLDAYEVTAARFLRFVEGYDAWRAGGQPAAGAGGHPRLTGSGLQAGDQRELPEAGEFLEQRVRECSQVPLSTLAGESPAPTLPLNCISWYEAAAFCAWDGGRLPTYAEWYHASVAGERDRVYPWGNDPAPSPAYAVYGCEGGLLLGQCAVPPVGSAPAGAGFFGQEDLQGSMSEWLLDGARDAYTEGCTDCGAAGAEGLRFIGGASWIDPVEVVETGRFVPAIEASVRAPFVGLRCARDGG